MTTTELQTTPTPSSSQPRVAELREEIADVNHSIRDLEREISDLQFEVAFLENQRDDLETELATELWSAEHEWRKLREYEIPIHAHDILHVFPSRPSPSWVAEARRALRRIKVAP
jgi:chromosome segregation ATPase